MSFNGARERCVSRGSAESVPCADDELTKYCDESADCASGALCCKTYDCSSEDCPPKLACEKPRCIVEMAEACLSADQCSAGFRCNIEPGDQQGTCVLEHPGTSCGDERCGGDTPVCRWSHTSQSGTCAARNLADAEATDGDVAWLSCASPRDCAGYACGKMFNSPVQSYFCATPSFAGDRFSPILCTSLRDCPAHWGAAATGCAPPGDGQAPSFTKMCVYPGEE